VEVEVEEEEEEEEEEDGGGDRKTMRDGRPGAPSGSCTA
jgi:hypothetical protein